jgi:hypothetical protein
MAKQVIDSRRTRTTSAQRADEFSYRYSRVRSMMDVPCNSILPSN